MGDISSADLDPYADIIGQIYEGSTDPQKWHSAMRGFLDLSGGRAAFLAIVDDRTNTLLSSTVVGPETSAMADAMDLYRGEMVQFDPGFESHRRKQTIFRFAETSEAMTSEPETWREFIRDVFGSGDYHSRTSPAGSDISVSFALHTHRDQSAVAPEQERLHAAVFDHLGRAAQLASTPPELSLTKEAVVMVDAIGRIVDASPAGEAALSRGAGLTVRHGAIQLHRRDEQHVLRQRIQDACHPGMRSGARRWMSVTREPPRMPWLLQFEPFPLLSLGVAGGVYYCTITITGEARDDAIDPDMLRAMFDLTPREAQMASLLATCADELPAIAERLGIGYETARSHSRAVLAKIGVANRIELVRLLANYR
ncbi:MAG: helix-turn-helix transcriptional regulator [Pontixanthobacter sp.]